MNICIISNLKEKGYGESTRPYYLSLELRKLGYNILHVCEKSSSTDEAGIHYVPLHQFKFPVRTLERLCNFIYLFLKLRSFKPVLIYVHQFNNGRWATATRTLPRVPIVFDAHTSVYFENRIFGLGKEREEYVFNLEKAVCLKSDYIIAASVPTKNLLVQQYGLEPDKISVLENATAMVPVSSPKELSDSNFVCSATLPFDGFESNTMALEFLFQVAQKIYEQNSAITLQVLGGGEKPAPPVPNIIYIGYVQHLEDYLLPSHVCLAPYPEKAVCGGIRNKVCDYLALGKAIVSTSEGMRGFMDAVEGYHYLQADNAEQFATAILKLFADKQLRKKLELNALSLSSNYQWNKRGGKLDGFFRTILENQELRR